MGIEEVSCPKCGKSTKVRANKAINLTEKPKMKKDIIEGKINSAICLKCGSKMNLRTHILLSYLEPPKWIWLVSKKHQNPGYQKEFFEKIAPQTSISSIPQQMAFVDFGEHCKGLEFILNDKEPKCCEEWLELGKIQSGYDAVECYKNALRIDHKNVEAKKLLNDEFDKLKTYT